MHIPFVHLVEFKLFAQFPVDHLAHSVTTSTILLRLVFFLWHSQSLWRCFVLLSEDIQFGYFGFLPVSSLVVVISLSPCFFLCILLVAASMDRGYLECWQVFLHLFVTHTVCLLHLLDVRPYAKSWVILFSICWSSSLVHFKNGPEYLTRGTEHVFIPLMRFLLRSLLSSSSEEIFFLIFFFHLRMFDGVRFQYSSICEFHFLQAFWFLLDFVVLFLPPFVVFRFSLLHDIFFYAKFHPYVFTIYSHCLY